MLGAGHTLKAHIIHILIGTLAMIICAVLASFLLPGGRDFRPTAIMMAFMILIVAAILRAGFRRTAVELFACLFCAEFFTLCVIAHFPGCSGFEIFDSFNLSWLMTMSIFIAVPWSVGLLTGNLLLRIRKKE